MEGQQSFLNKLAGSGPLAFIFAKIRNKLLATILFTSMVPLMSVAVLNYYMTSKELNKKEFASMQVIAEATKSKVQDFLKGQSNDLHLLAESPFVVEAAIDFLNTTEEEGAGDFSVGAQLMRSIYLDQGNLRDADDGSAYSMMHSKYHPYLAELREIYDLKDVYIVGKDGTVLYTATKKGPYGTNLISGEFKEEGLGRAFNKMNNESTDTIVFQDFSLSSTFGEQTAFYATTVHDKTEESVDVDVEAAEHTDDHDVESTVEHEVELILITEFSISKINKLMIPENRAGKTDEMYLIGPEGQWRNDSRFLKMLGTESTMMNKEFTVETEATKAAMAKEQGVGIIKGYKGADVLSVWSPIVIQQATPDSPELTWSLLVEIEEQEIKAAVDKVRNVTLLVIAGAFFVLVFVSFLVSGGLVMQVNAISELFAMIGMGDFDARVEVSSQDELGEMAESLNTMLDSILTLIQSQEERDAIQDSIKELLDEVAIIAEGDLTIEAEVREDITGSIADSFNHMIHQLRGVIRNVQDATIQVSSSANEIQTTAEHLAQGSESQASQILDTSAAIDEMAVSIQQVSENAALSATVGEQAKVNSQQGAKSVQDTITGMNKIRGQVQETAKRIKRLGESSQEIGDIVQLIGDIADRTSILALNASIQAAMAGDAGRGFAVVAEEVERLAERSTNATKQIDGLIKTIQSEVSEAVTAMETTTQEVVSGSQVADQAGQALTEIEGVSNRLSELIQSISLSAKQQARGSEALAGSMNQIADVTQQTAAGTKQAAVSISNLAHLADDLRGSISTFKLPDNGDSAAV